MSIKNIFGYVSGQNYQPAAELNQEKKKRGFLLSKNF